MLLILIFIFYFIYKYIVKVNIGLKNKYYKHQLDFNEIILAFDDENLEYIAKTFSLKTKISNISDFKYNKYVSIIYFYNDNPIIIPINYLNSDIKRLIKNSIGKDILI